MFINIARWVLALPAGALAAFLTQMFTDVAFGLCYGSETVYRFYDSPDMAGMPVSGTLILLVTRIATAAILLYTTIVLVPNYKRQAAVILVVVLSMLSIGWFISLVWSAFNMDYTITAGMWYRLILEGISLFLGIVVGAKIAVTRNAQTSG